jgi:hypothetical protein
MSTMPLEKRAALALRADDISSQAIAELLDELTEGIAEADEAATEARAQAADPEVSKDARAELARADAAELCRDRLQTLLGRLRLRHDLVRAQEERTAIEVEGVAIDAKADSLAASIAERCPALIAELANLFSWARTIDAEIANHNMRRAQLAFAQGGDSSTMPALAGIEERARPGLAGSLLVGTRLVSFEDAATQIWPPTPAIDMDFIQRLDEQVRAMPSGWRLTELRNEAAAADSRIAGEYFDRLNAQAEARQAAEAAEHPQRDSIEAWRMANTGGI